MGIITEYLASGKQPFRLGQGQRFIKIIIQFSREVVFKPSFISATCYIIYHFCFTHCLTF